MKPKTLLLLLAYLSFAATTPYGASAQTMESNEAILRLEEIDEHETLTPTPPPLPTTNISIPPKKENLPQPEIDLPIDLTRTLSLTLSTDLIDFGALSPTSQTTRTLTTTVTGTTPGVIFYTMQNRNLTNQEDVSIPKTTCDNGTCSEGVASVWNSTLSFGLGYTCEGLSCDEDFVNSAYRPLAQYLTSFAHAQLGIGFKRVIKMPLTVNVQGTQAEGSYHNTMYILAVPTL